MVDQQKYLDGIHLQKYLNLILLFVSKEITTEFFEKNFLATRRNDPYWMSGSFENSISQILDTFFLDVDDYVPDELRDGTNKLNINEKELLKRAKCTLDKLQNQINI
ncbi:colicin immunity domain-containing protein [Pedobacter psychroterrae]|uniref:Colicin D immunity protein domain-containing protein n=1 Tax=Pedobacter psychroterrae TaxID=2530453 RepID=A0A4R0NL97_9SPHI|nr:colicin immunity domain-containing protein [Pedobacter psychroterrae]TCC99784.1 hypothetical protein EZ437_16210 [Pedobacter psychroterrae]